MAESRLIQKQLAGKEDLLLGVGTVSQARATGIKTITKLNATHFGGVLVVDTINDLNTLDKNQLDEQVVFVKEDGYTYIYNGTSWETKTTTVDTIADLKNISYPANTVWVSGYHTKNDGAFGSHIFRLKGVKTTETDNGGTVIIATIGGTAYVYELQYDGAVNVKWFGANTTRSDNQVAIQLAIDSFPNGGSVLIPNCELKISGTIYLKDNISLLGEERDIGYLNSFSYKSKLLAVAIFDKMIDVTGAHISISNIGIDGAKLCNYGLITEGPFGRIGGASYTKLSITGFNKTGIRLQNGGLSKIYNCQVSDCLEVGIDMEGWGDAEISGCYINTINMDSLSTVNAPSTATVYGVGIRIRKSALGQAGNFNIHGGKIEFTRVGILINAGQGINITGVNFDSNRKASILLQSDTTPLPLAKTLYDNTVTTSIMINGNRFLGGLQGTQSTTAHIISNYSRFVTIAGNGFKRANDAAGDFFGSPVVGPDYGIWLYNSEECNITGNDLEASALTHCLVIQNVAINAARNRISGNSLDGSELIDNGTLLKENAIGGLLVSAPNGALYNTSTNAYIENDGTKNSALSVYTKAPPSSGGIIQFGTTSAASSADFFMIGQSGNGTNVTTSNLFIKTNGNIENTNNSYGGLSDARLKEKIEDATNKLDDIMKVKIRNFHFIGKDEKQIGVIAQEIEEIFPSIVTTNIIDGIEIKSVKYSVLVPIMLKALQEQQEIINDLKVRVEKLELGAK